MSSLINTLRGYGFDGVDLAYNFPKLPPKVVKGFFKRIWHKVKNFFVGEKEVIVDEFEAQHKEQFTDLVSYLKLSLTANNLMLMVSVLPNVNSTGKRITNKSFCVLTNSNRFIFSCSVHGREHVKKSR